MEHEKCPKLLLGRLSNLLSRIAKAKDLEQLKACLVIRDIQDMHSGFSTSAPSFNCHEGGDQNFLSGLFAAERKCLIKLVGHSHQHTAATLHTTQQAVEGITALSSMVLGVSSSIGCILEGITQIELAKLMREEGEQSGPAHAMMQHVSSPAETGQKDDIKGNMDHRGHS
jgi:hypothetical protein